MVAEDGHIEVMLMLITALGWEDFGPPGCCIKPLPPNPTSLHIHLNTFPCLMTVGHVGLVKRPALVSYTLRTL